MALWQGRAAPAPAVHGELVVEAVGEAVAGAHVAGGHCSCWLLLSSATMGTWKYIFTLHPLYLEALGRLGGGGWQLVLGGQPGPGRARPGAGDVARGVAGGNMVSIVTIN